MNQARTRSVPPGIERPQTAGFTLTEIAVALAILATALVALLGLFPAGFDASRKAVDSTVVTLILGNVQQRMKGERLQPGPLSFSPAYYDDRGTFVPADADEEHLAQRRYRVEVEVQEWQSPPQDTGSLKPVKISVFYPIKPKTGDPLGVKDGRPPLPQITVTTAIAASTGPSWQAIDSTYIPKVDF